MVLGISQESLLRFLTVGWLINCFRDESISRHDIFDLFALPERINFDKVGVNITYQSRATLRTLILPRSVVRTLW